MCSTVGSDIQTFKYQKHFISGQIDFRNSNGLVLRCPVLTVLLEPFRQNGVPPFEFGTGNGRAKYHSYKMAAVYVVRFIQSSFKILSDHSKTGLIWYSNLHCSRNIWLPHNLKNGPETKFGI
jgi:hypothetical protein